MTEGGNEKVFPKSKNSTERPQSHYLYKNVSVGWNDTYLFSLFNFSNYHDGSEALLLGDVHVILDITEDGGLHVQSRPVGSLATQEEPGALLQSSLAVLHQLGEVSQVVLGAVLDGPVQWVSGLHLPRLGDSPAQQARLV